MIINIPIIIIERNRKKICENVNNINDEEEKRERERRRNDEDDDDEG